MISDGVTGVWVFANNTFIVREVRRNTRGKRLYPVTRRMIAAIGASRMAPASVNGGVLTIHLFGDNKITDLQAIERWHDLVVARCSRRVWQVKCAAVFSHIEEITCPSSISHQSVQQVMLATHQRGKRKRYPEVTRRRFWRPRPELNRGTRICSPLRHHSATRPHTLVCLSDGRDLERIHFRCNRGVGKTPDKFFHAALGSGKSPFRCFDRIGALCRLLNQILPSRTRIRTMTSTRPRPPDGPHP